MGWLKRRVLPVIVEQLRRGTTPDKIALTISIGFTLACFPVVGLTTVLCLAAGALLELNHPILQLVNHLSFPIQVALLVPFYKTGDRLFGAAPVSFNPALMRGLFRSDFAGALRAYGMTGLRGIAVWCLAAPFSASILYRLLAPVLRRLSENR